MSRLTTPWPRRGESRVHARHSTRPRKRALRDAETASLNYVSCCIYPTTVHGAGGMSDGDPWG